VELPAEEENKDGADINLEEDNELDEQFDDLEGVDPSGTAETKDDLWITWYICVQNFMLIIIIKLYW